MRLCSGLAVLAIAKARSPNAATTRSLARRSNLDQNGIARASYKGPAAVILPDRESLSHFGFPSDGSHPIALSTKADTSRPLARYHAPLVALVPQSAPR